MPNTKITTKLNTPADRRAVFVENMLLGFTANEAARIAGYKNPGKASWDLMKDPRVLEPLEKYREELAEKSEFTRLKSAQMLMEAFDIAKLQGDARGMVTSVQELNKMHGYHASTKINVKSEHTHTHKLADMSSVPTEKLLEMAALEGDFEVIEDGVGREETH